MFNTVIRPLLEGFSEPVQVEYRSIEPGQVWGVEGSDAVRWFVLSPDRIIPLFAGGEDHTKASFVHTYKDALYLISDATTYRSKDWPEQWRNSTRLEAVRLESV